MSSFMDMEYRPASPTFPIFPEESDNEGMYYHPTSPTYSIFGGEESEEEIWYRPTSPRLSKLEDQEHAMDSGVDEMIDVAAAETISEGVGSSSLSADEDMWYRTTSPSLSNVDTMPSGVTETNRGKGTSWGLKSSGIERESPVPMRHLGIDEFRRRRGAGSRQQDVYRCAWKQTGVNGLLEICD